MNTRIDKIKVKNHFHYDWWKYVVSFVAILIIWNIVFTMTRPQTPAELKVDTYFVGKYVDDMKLSEIGKTALKDFPNQKEINLAGITLLSKQDNAGWQKLMVLFAAKEGDAYVLDYDIFKEIASKQGFLPLDQYIADSRLKVDKNIPLDRVTLKAEGDTQSHIYGIPIDQLKGLEVTQYDIKGKVIAITNFTKNKENALGVVDWLLQHEK